MARHFTATPDKTANTDASSVGGMRGSVMLLLDGFLDAGPG